MKQALLIAVCLLCVGLQDANAQAGNDPGQQQKAGGTQNSQANAIPTVIPPGQANTEQHCSRQAGNEGQQEQKRASSESSKLTDWIQATIAVLLFLVVCWQAYISNQQRKEMREQREAIETTERAYIGIAKMELLISGDEPRLEITWINGGKTPAWHFRCVPSLNIGEKPEPKRFLTENDDFSDIRNSFIPAGAERPVSYTDLGVTLSNEVLSRLGGNNNNLYAVMKGTYRDVRWKRREFEYWALYEHHPSPQFVELESDYEKKQTNPS